MCDGDLGKSLIGLIILLEWETKSSAQSDTRGDVEVLKKEKKDVSFLGKWKSGSAREP